MTFFAQGPLDGRTNDYPRIQTATFEEAIDECIVRWSDGRPTKLRWKEFGTMAQTFGLKGKYLKAVVYYDDNDMWDVCGNVFEVN